MPEKDLVIDLKVLMYKDKKLFEKIVMSTNFRRIPKLFTEEEACFLFLTKGSFQYRTPNHLLTFNQGEAMLSKCGNYFIEQMADRPNQKSDTISAISAYFYPSIIKDFFQSDLSLKSFQSDFDTSKVSVEPLLKAFLESLDYLIENPNLVDENLLLTKLKELLLLLSKSKEAPSIQAFITSLFVPHQYKFSEIVQQNLYANLSLEDFAKLCNCSLATFKRKFTELYGESPAKYMLTKRLEKASQLLLIKSKSKADIAYECGFESVSSFDRAFKKQFRKSPSEYQSS